MPISTFRDAQERYARIRRRAYDVVEKRIESLSPASIPVRLSDIDGHALEVRRRTWVYPHWSGSGGWDWDEIAGSVLRRPSAFPVAVWGGDRLLALAVGRTSKRRTSGKRCTLSLHYIEGHPDRTHPLRHRILPIVFDTADEYGRAIGATRVRLVDPLPGSAPLYLHARFGLAGRYGQHVYWERAIGSHVTEDGDQA
jgi:hypothetical protein